MAVALSSLRITTEGDRASYVRAREADPRAPTFSISGRRTDSGETY
jgi:hypothetical protein